MRGLSRRERRTRAVVNWLREHRALWSDLPSDPMRRRLRLQRIVEMLKQAGYYSLKTYWPDVRIEALLLKVAEKK